MLSDEKQRFMPAQGVMGTTDEAISWRMRVAVVTHLTRIAVNSNSRPVVYERTVSRTPEEDSRLLS